MPLAEPLLQGEIELKSMHDTLRTDSTQRTDSNLTLRAKCWRTLSVRATKFGRLSSHWPSLLVEAVVITLITGNIVIVIHEDSSSNPKSWQHFSVMWVWVSFCVFLVEYLVRLWACVEESSGVYKHWIWGRLKWARKPLSLVELVALVPFWAELVISPTYARGTAKVGGLIRGMQVAILFSVLKMERQTKAFKILGSIVFRHGDQLRIVFHTTMVMIVISSIVIYLDGGGSTTESLVSTHWTFAECIYWSVITMTTVGYGQYVPQKPFGQFWACCVAFFGISVIALLTGIMGAGFFEIYEEDRNMLTELNTILQQNGLTPASSRQISRQESEISVASDGYPDSSKQLSDSLMGVTLPPHLNEWLETRGQSVRTVTLSSRHSIGTTMPRSFSAQAMSSLNQPASGLLESRQPAKSVGMNCSKSDLESEAQFIRAIAEISESQNKMELMLQRVRADQIELEEKSHERMEQIQQSLSLIHEKLNQNRRTSIRKS